MSDEPTDESAGDSTGSNGTDDGEVAVSASLGASAVLELDTVDVETATVRIRRVTADDETAGLELETDVGPVAVECVLNPSETATLVEELTPISEEMNGESDDDTESTE